MDILDLCFLKCSRKTRNTGSLWGLAGHTEPRALCLDAPGWTPHTCRVREALSQAPSCPEVGLSSVCFAHPEALHSPCCQAGKDQSKTRSEQAPPLTACRVRDLGQVTHLSSPQFPHFKGWIIFSTTTLQSRPYSKSWWL